MSAPRPGLSARSRKFVGTVLMVLLVLCWALAAMALAQGRVTTLPAFWQFLAYVVLGAGWIVPAAVLIRWMLRHDRRHDTL
ncbi:DUF2842 domain-containing protein [Ancylobacter vacuolatus]|uniref:DUF2842 domain-containing protein n=1 Tax=Ancylobacter vacuolatus TaxID=223389 RepID=A0ABU0DBW6_9HYPH|nr:DUF2842 domain-containing protein [Ancylobacter vacuolatus]MDQ0345917.1 hypothetical protein [Ancylobacter vacuolatus]